ncbi:MAG: SNF2-related protein [Myxococcaceae bacterium]|nr:SNF2-related protein [Myxococcaceae bacterium]
MTTPLGLHVQLIPYGGSFRFAVWFERLSDPPAFRAPRLNPSQVRSHPAQVAHRDRPAAVPADAERTQLVVRLPRLANARPVPLPGFVPAMDLRGAALDARDHGLMEFLVDAWIIPPALTLAPLGRLLHDWSTRYGAGLVSPHAPAVVALLDELAARVARGPLLPTLAPSPAALHALVHALPQPAQPVVLGWVPPVTLAELHRLHRAFAAPPLLAAIDDTDPNAWSFERRPTRLALFLLEAFSAASAGAPDAPSDESVVASLAAAVARGDAAPMHRAHGSCLFPQHPFLAPVAAPPRDHLHARLHPLDAPDARGDTWALELGVLKDERAFLPLAALAAQGSLEDAFVEHDERLFLHPAPVVARDWRSVVASGGMLLRRPEALTGQLRVTEDLAQRVLAQRPGALAGYEYDEWVDALGLPTARRRPKDLVAFTAAPGSASIARVRVRWDLAGDPADPTRLGLHSARFVPHLELALGDDTLDPAAAASLLQSSTDAFLKIHDHVLPRADLVAAMELLRAREKVLRNLGADRGVNYSGAIALDDEWAAERAAQVESVFSARWESFLSGLRDGAGVPAIAAPAGFRGALRPYQERGLSWLAFLAAQGFGGCLADDMGLGKTVQVLALLATRRAPGAPAPRGPDLVVCPTAVVINWAKEARKFTPGLSVFVHQGLGRERDAGAFAQAATKSDVVVTSYAVARRDEALLTAVRWGAVIIDEAQNLKNPNALQTRALRNLDAESKFGLTGTPVENHLRDLWSIFDVTVPGLLGGATRFARTFETPARNGDATAHARLARRVGPFLLRRTKRDPAVAADLPPLQLQDLACELTPEQVALYQAMTEATFQGIEDKDGMQRRAHILAALTRFKQICNHPESFEPERPAVLFGRSGKLDRVLDVLEELLAEEQRVLIFTQFMEMGRILQRALAARFKLDAGFYHGSLTTAQREALVEGFQAGTGSPVLILSLRAGGTGLNLTAASAVIHYDRWWNPAVEDQATDRAHRIGQTRRVNVYRLVTEGTLEERVAELLETKRAMADKILGGADESWITEMDDRALRAFLSLGAAAKEGA